MIDSGLIVSCQALPDEPLHSHFIMGRMALAAMHGGAKGIRANGVEDIREIKKNVKLPIIGIVKINYPGIVPYITPTMNEVEALVMEGVNVIAVDATISQDRKFLSSLRHCYPDQKFMADISTIEEGLEADRMGFDYIGTTLVGYTEQSKGLNNFGVLKGLIDVCKYAKIIAEGNFDTPEKAASAIVIGAFAVVVGGAITRPQLITKNFADAIKKAK